MIVTAVRDDGSVHPTPEDPPAPASAAAAQTAPAAVAAETGPAVAQTGAARSGRSPRDMALSIIVLLIPIFLLVGLYRLVGNEEPPVIDPAPAYAAARSANRFPVLEATPLPAGWQLQRAAYANDRPGGLLRIGVRSATGGAMQILQTAAAPDEIVPTELGTGGQPGGTVDVTGRSWSAYDGGRPGERALVLAESGRTVIVYGRADQADLRTLAAVLR